MSPSPPSGPSPAGIFPRPLPADQAHPRWGDPLLRGAFLVIGIIVSYQLAVTLLHPAWSSAVTDWLRAALAWPELAVVVFVSIWLSRAHQPEALSSWMLSLAILSYTIARNLWTVDDRLIFPNHVPFPSFPDLFFILQYPFFFLAIVLMPGVPPWGPRLKVVLDCVLLMGAASALSWYFILAPIYLQSGESLAGKVVNLAYPLGDLCLLFGLTVALVYRRCQVARAVLLILIVAVVCLVIADSWSAWLLLYPSHVYQTGAPPDLFWTTFDLLLPLAGLVQVRLIQRALAAPEGLRVKPLHRPPIQREDLREVFRVLSPFAAALLACMMIAVRAIVEPIRLMQPLGPVLVIFGLLVVALVRQGLTVLENAQLRRKWAMSQAQEQALQETTRRMEAFLGIVGHELKTPLTTVLLSLQLLQRRAQPQVDRSSAGSAQPPRPIGPAELELPLRQAGRLSRLINDLLDNSRIQAGRLALRRERVDLRAVVDGAVEEQRHAWGERPIRVWAPAGPVEVEGDGERLGQVVTNYLTNALKYSGEGTAVEVGVEKQEGQGQVWVRDQGPGLGKEERERVWERFYRAEGVPIASGSGVGLGLGLYISQMIIEGHGGQVGVESEPGQGATFWFRLPLARPADTG
jgi:signal transduction histidine kinase